MGAVRVNDGARQGQADALSRAIYGLGGRSGRWLIGLVPVVYWVTTLCVHDGKKPKVCTLLYEARLRGNETSSERHTTTPKPASFLSSCPQRTPCFARISQNPHLT